MAKGGSATKGRGKARAASARKLRANQGCAVEVEAAPEEPLIDRDAGRDIAGVVLAIVAVVSFCAVVMPASAPVAAAIAGFYHLGFGLGAYVLPIALLAVAVLLFLRGGVPVRGRTVVGVALIFTAVCTFLSLLVPGTGQSTDAMFAPENLSVSGGYLGAFVASALQGALGKVIAVVLALGLAVLGLVVIGLSVSQIVRDAADHAAALSRRRQVDENANPWGEAVPAPVTAQAAAPRGRTTGSAAPAPQQQLFDESGAAATTFLGNRETTVLEPEDQPDEDPFVDVSDELSAERAKTTLIPVKERFAEHMDEVDAMPVASDAASTAAAGAVGVIGSARRKLDGAGAEGSVAVPPIPDFLKPAAAKAPADETPTGEDEASELPWDAKLQEGPKPASKPKSKVAAAPVSPAAADAEDGRELPPASMLRHSPNSARAAATSKELEQTAAALQSTLQEFGLRSSVVGWIAGPTVTTFKIQPGEGERVSRITSLEDDIALTLATDSVRIFAPIPGTSLVGIEIPNRNRQTVSFGDILPYVKGGPLEFALGRDAEGTPMVADLAKMPHLLIAGTTGSGKSVVISSIVMSLLMRTFPEDVRLIMIDPKRVEFAPYDGLPHLYVPVVTEPKQAASALQWAVSEMERRLKIFERIGVRKISTFNEKQAAGEFEKYDNPPAKLPYLVIVIDELSDLMMVAGKDVEASIVRIAQLGRAAGIHMIVATQRPSSNVVTGLIKANITNRIGLTVATGIDSRVILDQTGAEKLTGQGDMLFSRVDWGKPKRIQGCYVSDEEIFSVVAVAKEHCHADYHEEILSAVAPAAMGGGAAPEPQEDDPLLWDAARIVVDSQLGSTSGLQRRLKVGYARAGRIMDMLEEKGIVGPPDGSKPREVLLDMEALKALEALESPLTEEEIRGDN